MALGDDERRQKSTRHREAAFSRWESTPKRWWRRTTESIADALNAAYCATAGRLLDDKRGR